MPSGGYFAVLQTGRKRPLRLRARGITGSYSRRAEGSWSSSCCEFQAVKIHDSFIHPANGYMQVRLTRPVLFCFFFRAGSSTFVGHRKRALEDLPLV